jgi:secreted trypsin-like serine protease
MTSRFRDAAAVLALILALFGTVQGAVANPYREFVQARLAAKQGPGAAQTGRIATPRIVGGDRAGILTHRFQAALLFAGVKDNFAAFFCGGSIYRSRFVITAAHCSDFVSAGSVRVLAGTNKLDGSGKRYRVKSITVHPKWDPFTFDYDVALWVLEEVVPGMPELYISRRDPAPGTMMKVTGWGALADGGSFPVQLRKVRLPKVSRTNCNDANSYNGEITRRMTCAGFDAGGKDSCFGDSGGPMTRPRADGRRILTGIVSWGDGCALPNKFGVYARVSNSEIRDFIRDATWPWPLLSQ